MPGLIKLKRVVIKDLIAYRVMKRMEYATKLLLDTRYASGNYQVVNYGIGGQVATHVDHKGNQTYSEGANKWYAIGGDKHATFMIYLSTVNVGGGTAFPLLGLRSNAVSGDALFWINMWSDGKIDHLSVHGGCPTFIGSKWITSKWIMSYDNFRESPCNLEEFQRQNKFLMWRK